MNEQEVCYEIGPNDYSRKKAKRVGRGTGSGHGGTSCKGHKGQRCRSGQARPYVGFEGGQRPLYRRLPKRGFFNLFKKEWGIINLTQLNNIEDSTVIDINYLHEKGYIERRIKLLKILGTGELNKKLTVKADAITESAKEKLEKAGCTVEIKEKIVDENAKIGKKAARKNKKG